MKTTICNARHLFLLLCFTLFSGLQTIAQEAASQTHVTETKTSSTTAPAASPEWMSNPWVWVGAGIVVLLLLIGVFSSRSGRSSEIKRTTTTRTEVNND